MGSEDYATSNSNPNGDESSSLAARRARLRGTLAKQATPPDPYQPDPYMVASGSATASSNGAAPPDAAASAAAALFGEAPGGNGGVPGGNGGVPGGNGGVPGGNGGAPSGNGGVSAPQVSSLSSASFFANTSSSQDQNNKSEEKASFFSEPEVESVPESEPEPAPQATPRSERRRGGNSAAAIMPAAEPAAPVPEPISTPQMAPAPMNAPTPAPVAMPEPSNLTMPMEPNYSTMPIEPSYSPGPEPNYASMPSDPSFPTQPADSSYSSMPMDSYQSMPTESYQSMPAEPGYAPVPPQAATAPLPPQPDMAPSAVSGGDLSAPAQPMNYVYGISADLAEPHGVQTQAIEIMNNIDQAMSACAMNLSELQKIATEQTDALKGVAESLQNQSFFEIGLNLNSLMESLSAALEPMKAVGELVPAIDQLVSVMETREASSVGEESTKLTREQLITNLAEQLSAGQIDPWTFKCAYMAVFPTEHPADLLHRLVDLLGTQRLSGELFRSAYDAVQAPDPPERPGSASSGEGGETRTIVKTVQDETILAQLDELKRSNEEFAKKHEDIQKRLEQKDSEFGQVLATKEQELQEAQELLNSRWEEFNTRYDELTETLHKRDEVLQEREAELAKKESENAQLRSQMEELRDQTKEMVADLQRQLSAKPKEEAPKQQGFFDTAPNTAQQPAPQQQPGQLFDATQGARPLFGATDAQSQQNQNPLEQLQPAVAPQVPQQVAPQQQQAPAMQQPMAPQAAQNASAQAVPRPSAPTTPFVSGAGSYGSGVRAQVFEVIVRQALAGAPWREICAGPMQVNNISPEEVEAEVKRRQALLKK